MMRECPERKGERVGRRFIFQLESAKSRPPGECPGSGNAKPDVEDPGNEHRVPQLWLYSIHGSPGVAAGSRETGSVTNLNSILLQVCISYRVTRDRSQEIVIELWW